MTSVSPQLSWTLVVAGLLSLVAALAMGLFNRGNQFKVDGKTVLITGGSQGMGRAVAKLLASKGASVVIVARNIKKLQDAVEYVSSAAANASTQRFHYISADLTSAGDCSRLIQEATAWNHDAPPDIVWCCAGSAYPGFFLEAPVEKLREQMDSNYWSAAYTAHATLKSWLAPSKSSVAITTPRHLVLTSSVVAFYPIVGYAGYSPAKAAIRSLSDTLSQELCLYNGSRQHGSSPGPAADVRIHTIFPGTIFSPGYEIENQTKPAITKKLEEDEGGQTEDEIAHISVKALEKGEYLVTAAFLGSAMRASAWGGSPRNNRVRDTVMSWITSIAWLFVQPDLDGKTWKWGKEKGHPSFYDAQPAAPVG